MTKSTAVPHRTRQRMLRLVYDIPSNHPRVPYFDAMAERLRDVSGGGLTIASNLDGTVYPGIRSIEAMQAGEAEMTFVNAGNLEAVDPRLGVVNLPFTFGDRMMLKEETRRATVELLDDITKQHGMRLVTLMRGTDVIFVFRDGPVVTREGFKGLRIRTASGGISDEIVTRLGATAVVLPVPELKAAFERGEVDGVFTSPGAWSSQLGMLAPYALHVPELTMVTYALLVRSDVMDDLASDERAALLGAAQSEVLDRWAAMADDDEALIFAMRARGARFDRVEETSPWREALRPIAARFADSQPDMWNRFQSLPGASALQGV